MFKKFYTLIFIFLIIDSCRMPDNFGFYQPITMKMDVPDGPPEFKSGWYNGCRSGLSTKQFSNSVIYDQSFKNDFTGPQYGYGNYQHDPIFQAAWSQGFFVCTTYSGTFTSNNTMKFAPLQ